MSVRNIRAMFEARKQESPPERGRSPADSSPAGTESPRPLSKVRTSFVAIEKDGRIGLQRNPSETSSLSGRKLSADPEGSSSILQENIVANASSPSASRPDLSRAPASAISIGSQQDLGRSPAGGGTPFTNPPASENPLASAPSGSTALIGGKQAGLAESPQIKQASERESEASPSPGDKKPGRVAEQVGKVQTPVAFGQNKGEAGPGAPEGVNGGGDKVPSSGAAGIKSLDGVDKTTVTKPTVETAKTTPKPAADTTQTPIKPVANTFQTPVKPAAENAQKTAKPTAENAQETMKPAADTAQKPTKPTVDAAQKTTSAQPTKAPRSVSQPKPAAKPTETAPRRPTTPPADKKTTQKKPASTRGSPEGFVKPRPKSPTRPVKLPAGLTSHTAASGSRTRAASGGGPPSAHANHANTARPSSRTSTASGTAGKGMRRSASAAGRQRPALGPPPKLPAKDHPVPKKESKVDEGFLARMMRPTQSYANKVNEKVPTTPPRKTAGATKKPASAKSGSAKKPVSRATSAATSAAGSPEADKRVESSAPKNVAPVVKQTPIAEESITIPKRAKADGATSMPPKTPEHEPTIMEEKEETIAGLPMASSAPKSSTEPQVEEANAPLVNGGHKDATIEEEL